MGVKTENNVGSKVEKQSTEVIEEVEKPRSDSWDTGTIKIEL